ncbi:MAG TPA: HepT-like ribonuclease domain-containing protein [Bryobacteraceae bacterium]|nr:HepT-like ribonuclease domain-containing protein [Bryobacteraceae bacterium]
MPQAAREKGNVPVSILFSAVCRNLEVIGEASPKIGAEFRAANPEVPWREMNALRNVLIHNYEGADSELVWGIVERDIPPLLEAVRKLVQSGEKS